MLMFWGEIRAQLNFREINPTNHAAGIAIGEGAAFGAIFMAILGVILMFTTTVYLVDSKTAKWFYGMLLVILILPLFVLPRID